MLFKVVSIYDRAAGVYGRPGFVPSAGVAVRDFTDEVNRAADDNQLYKHPDDFDLYSLGGFDDNAADFLPLLELLVRGKDVVKSSSSN